MPRSVKPQFGQIGHATGLHSQRFPSWDSRIGRAFGDAYKAVARECNKPTATTTEVNMTNPISLHSAAANEAPSLPEGTTLFDLISALQDAADESTESRESADMLVFASLVELRHSLRGVEEDATRKAA